MICSGRNALTGENVTVRFGDTIETVEPAPAGEAVYLAPGWIDVQVNGFAGVDYNSPTTPHEEIARSIEVLHSTGVTRFYPTVITGGPDDMLGALRNLCHARSSLAEGAIMDGFHVEGPHISPEDGPRGAHPKHWVRPPDVEEFLRWQDAAEGHIRIVTLSPEWPEAPRYIESLVERGIVISIGHTKATATQIGDAVAAGATMSTHLGNGAHSMMPRHPNYIWDQLAEDRLSAGFIGDGIHLPPSFLKAAIRAKQVERAFLVTDASTPAACPPGRYRLGEQEVDLTADQRVVLAGQDRLAGSALKMHNGVANLMRLAGLTLSDAVRLSTINPAVYGNVPGRTQGLAPGERADLVEFRLDPETSAIEILKTWVGGRRVYG
ncbi:MAG: N-acetylglucosamine-6-phosphate deacetylase [Bryobacterales bacterium]|nr:N-acetylglucosamine-6-phosphate deacetylase [Bryobacterales bacterium]